MFIPSPDMRIVLAQSYANERRGAARGRSFRFVHRIAARRQERRAQHAVAPVACATC